MVRSFSCRTALVLCLFAIAAFLAAPGAVSGQAARPAATVAEDPGEALVWIRYYKARPGLGSELLRFLVETDGPYLDSMVAQGTLLSWGVARPFNLVDDRWTHALWLTLPSWAEADSMVEAMSRLRDELGPEALAAFEHTLAPDSRRDLVLRHRVVVSAPDDGGGAEPRYIRLGYHRARSESYAEAEALYRDLHAPMCRRLIDEGVVEHCGLSVQAVASDSTWTHATWVMTGDLAGVGSYQSAFAAAAEASPEADGETFWERYRQVFDRRAYHSVLYRILHLGASRPLPPAPGDLRAPASQPEP